MKRERRGEDGELAAEWRRLRRAALFFAVCLTVVVVLGVVGLYH